MPKEIWPDLRKEIDSQVNRFAAYSTAKGSS
jgi:hypothetical protein